MNREEILKKIADLKEQVSQNQFEIIADKIVERRFHWHRSNRKFFMGRIIEKFRKKLIKEVELLLEPVLENQKEINFRFLYEIDRLKSECLSLETEKKQQNHEHENEAEAKKNDLSGQD